MALSLRSASSASELFSFPNPVDEVSARLVAAGVVTMALTALVLDLRWVTAVIAYGFVARVLAGPKLSPLALLVTRVVRPRLRIAPRPVPGPPKRFAQGIGAVFSLTVAVLALVFHRWGEAQVALALLASAAFLEAAFALCLGCHIFALLMRTGLVSRDVCERCDDLWSTRGAAAPEGPRPRGLAARR